jgi:hypothetical protein
MGQYKGLQSVSNCIHTESFYPMGFVTFGSLCIILCYKGVIFNLWSADPWVSVTATDGVRDCLG